jgi:hypothetical protein
MTARKTTTCLLAGAMTLLALAPAALASPAGSEYLPKAPQSGGHSGSASGGTSTSTLPEGTSGSKAKSQEAKNGSKKGKAQSNTVAPVSGGSSGGGGDSGSIFTSPVFLLIVAGIIVVVAGVLLRRRHTAKPAEGKTAAAPPRRRPGPAGGTPAAGPDKTTK